MKFLNTFPANEFTSILQKISVRKVLRKVIKNFCENSMNTIKIFSENSMNTIKNFSENSMKRYK